MCGIYIAPCSSKAYYMLRSKAIKASAKLYVQAPWPLGSMLSNKLVDLIGVIFDADFLDWTQQHSCNHFPL